MFLRTRLTTYEEWKAAHEKTGSVYFIKNAREDTIKIGHSFDPLRRLSELQVGNSSPLRILGIVAAALPIERIIHSQFPDGHASGEWFYDRQVISSWLDEMTHSQPICHHIWELVLGREFWDTWNEEAKKHTRHYWNPKTEQWEPPIK